MIINFVIFPFKKIDKSYKNLKSASIIDSGISASRVFLVPSIEGSRIDRV
jgi:hypothetical protein